MADADVIFLGGGGHAAVCLDVFRSVGRTVIGYLGPHSTDLDAPYLGTDDALADFDTDRVEVFVAIGSNRARHQLLKLIAEAGFRAPSAVHSSAVVSPTAVLGDGTIIMPSAVVNARTRLGRGVIVNTSASIDHDGDVGDAVHVAPGTHVAGTVTIADGAFLGVGVSVIPEARIGAWSVVGAGATVVTDIEPGSTVVGVPARPVRPNDSVRA
jgi:sugar O-acyltransferase (sialic acid O-acetyltransferase NeuD family)